MAQVILPSNTTYEGMFAWDSSGNNAYVDNAGWIKLIDENDSGDLSNVNITGVSDGNGLIWSSAQGRFNVGALPSTGFSIAMAVLYNKEKKMAQNFRRYVFNNVGTSAETIILLIVTIQLLEYPLLMLPLLQLM